MFDSRVTLKPRSPPARRRVRRRPDPAPSRACVRENKIILISQFSSLQSGSILVCVYTFYATVRACKKIAIEKKKQKKQRKTSENNDLQLAFYFKHASSTQKGCEMVGEISLTYDRDASFRCRRAKRGFLLTLARISARASLERAGTATTKN